MSEYVFKLPDLGEGTVEAEIAEWMVRVGDVILEEDPICAMLTEKAAVELTSPVSGRVVSLAGEEGDTVAVGSPLIVFETDAEAPAPEEIVVHRDQLRIRTPFVDVTFDPGGGIRSMRDARTGDVEKRKRLPWGNYQPSLVAGDGYRLVFPILGYRPTTIDVYDNDYREPPNREEILRRHAPKLNEVLKASRRFKR